jgi:putative transposase
LPVAEVCRKHGISNATYYQWKSKYSGVSASELKRIKDLEAENSKLKRMYAELALEDTAIKDIFCPESSNADRQACFERVDGRGPSTLSKQSLQISGFIAVGVVQTQN